MRERELEALDRNIEASLRRIFAPPAGLESLVERSLRPRKTRIRRPWRTLVLVGGAAAGLLLAWLARERALERDTGLPPGSGSLVYEVASLLPPVGPLEEPLGDPSDVRAPDVDAIYRAMDACQRRSEIPPCDEQDRLAETLTRTYGEELQLEPGAAWMLRGPFSSPEWPTGTILTGVADEHTAVLVAERDSTLACCLRPELSEGSGLRMFTWRVGGLVLTEITPLGEPRLIDCFRLD